MADVIFPDLEPAPLHQLRHLGVAHISVGVAVHHSASPPCPNSHYGYARERSAMRGVLENLFWGQLIDGRARPAGVVVRSPALESQILLWHKIVRTRGRRRATLEQTPLRTASLSQTGFAHTQTHRHGGETREDRPAQPSKVRVLVDPLVSTISDGRTIRAGDTVPIPDLAGMASGVPQISAGATALRCRTAVSATRACRSSAPRSTRLRRRIRPSTGRRSRRRRSWL